MNLTKKNCKVVLQALAKYCNVDKLMLAYCNYAIVLAGVKDEKVLPIVTAKNDFDYVYFSLYRKLEEHDPKLHNDTSDLMLQHNDCKLAIAPFQFAEKYNVTIEECEYAIAKQLVQRTKHTKLMVYYGGNNGFIIKPINSLEQLLIETDYG